MLQKGHCVVEGTSTLNLLIPDLEKEHMFGTACVQTLYREVQVWTVSRLSHALPNNGIKNRVCIAEGTENCYTSDLLLLVVKYATDKP